MGLQFEGWESTIAKLDELGGTAFSKKCVEKALGESKAYVNPQIEKAMSRLPAGGKYSTGATAGSLDTDLSVRWAGLVGEIKVGFDFDKSGLTSIFLMYGTPRMRPVTGLKSAIYGTKTKKEIGEIQMDAINAEIKKIMEGK